MLSRAAQASAADAEQLRNLLAGGRLLVQLNVYESATGKASMLTLLRNTRKLA
jgi:hypothetical protein